ncbi:intraflagellar transport protein 46 homolog [Lampris incognitus]|uniref:intraflagellar transport protein 46 homolog n=1 Tax=Lampris incognitus TaxID=2546036 RepID=UPI0024B54B35|nr:intraflagellar transport protein 46 homolog [Lampris incognitus]
MDRRKPSNLPFDESLEVNDSEEVHTPTPQTPAKTESKPKGRKVRSLTGANSSSDEFDEEDAPQKANKPISRQARLSPNEEDEEEEEESDEDDSDDDDEPGPEGAYDPADYESLPVSTEIKELFQYITRYMPQSIELEHKLKPFIPDFIPAVGDIDAFLKVPRPDGKPDDLGLLVLDEPCVKQSDPTVLSLWLSEETKQHGVTELKKVTSVSSPQRNPKAVDSWIESISELHRSKPPASVHYSRAMPDIDFLMQEWPQEFEELLARVDLPTADLDCDLKQYVDIICGLLDIPVYKNRVQSLHVLFTLYLEFKNLQLFKHTA